jgi:hypothetical protein
MKANKRHWSWSGSAPPAACRRPEAWWEPLLALSVPSRILRVLFAFLIAAVAAFLIYQGIQERSGASLTTRPAPRDEAA